jgi:hypothetical protein
VALSRVHDLINFIKTQELRSKINLDLFNELDDDQNANEAQKDLESFQHLKLFLEERLPPKLSDIYVTPADLEGLPPELIKELNLNSSDFKDFQLIDVIKSLGGIGSIDKILIAQYKLTGEIEVRSKLMSRLYRMSTKGLIYSHPTKKGIYSVEKIEEDLFGDDDESASDPKE